MPKVPKETTKTNTGRTKRPTPTAEEIAEDRRRKQKAAQFGQEWASFLRYSKEIELSVIRSITGRL